MFTIVMIKMVDGYVMCLADTIVQDGVNCAYIFNNKIKKYQMVVFLASSIVEKIVSHKDYECI